MPIKTATKWDGYPPDDSVTGWHWLIRLDGQHRALSAWEWDADDGTWNTDDGSSADEMARQFGSSADEMARQFSYYAPCVPPPTTCTTPPPSREDRLREALKKLLAQAGDWEDQQPDDTWIGSAHHIYVGAIREARAALADDLQESSSPVLSREEDLELRLRDAYDTIRALAKNVDFERTMPNETRQTIRAAFDVRGDST